MSAERTRYLSVRVSDDTLKRYRIAAIEEDTTLQDWVETHLDRAVTGPRKKRARS